MILWGIALWLKRGTDKPMPNTHKPTFFHISLHRFFVTGLFFLALSTVIPTHAQETTPLTISMIRNFGTAIGSNIKGTFTIRAQGPDTLQSVTFYLDGDPMGTVTTTPFNLKFNTDAYPPGTHTITAVGTTSSNQELQSNSITRSFLTPAQNIKGIILLVVPLLLLIIVGRFVANWISNRGQKEHSAEVAKINGPQGGTICPKCHKPFARHWWGLNLGTSKYDRCPHCQKWSLVTRQPPELLQAALDAMQQAENSPTETPHDNDENNRKRRLDDSRFEP
jgi:hypothetical protein